MTSRKSNKPDDTLPPPPSDTLKTLEGKNQPTAKPLFPIVGIGASAGGLEAFEQFFAALPARTGFAFILVPHLDPGHASLLTEILQRSAAIPVHEAEDLMAIAPDHVYIVPPNRDIAIFHGALHLTVPKLPRGQRMPIDAFLRSLADDRGDRAVGVILSGTGTDGTLGLRAIRGEGGITLVQAPETAKYDGMPTSAIHAGYASQTLPPEEMPAALIQRLASDFSRGKPVEPGEPTPNLNRVLLLLRSATGHDFSRYKKSTINRRIRRRMAQHDLTDLSIYTRYLKENPAEIHTLFKELLINVTSFFRDPEAFAAWKDEILPAQLADKPEGYVFRVWVVGCASGEEAYSIAILLREHMDEHAMDLHVQLYATDLDDDAIALARAGHYPPNIAADVSPERLRQFFVRDDTGYRVKKTIREMVVFAVQNVIKDPPFTKLDLLSCRNLMIYLEPELQKQLLPKFHWALKPGGVLFLSPSESIGNHSSLFSALNRKWKFYRALHGVRASVTEMPSRIAWATVSSQRSRENIVNKSLDTNFSEMTRRALIQFYAPASVVTDRSGNILFVHGETGKYLRPAPGQASLNVIDMAQEGLQSELRAALKDIESAPVLDHKTLIKTQNDYQPVSFSIHPLSPAAKDSVLLISFQDLPRDMPPKRRRQGATAPQIELLERELAITKESLEATIEEQQASNEELKSTNEELQSTNEELQSTNEELETSKEELQSVNEELITVNTELQVKIEQLVGMQNDMKNLLDNIHAGIIFLDQNLLIRRFTPEAAAVYRLVSTDVGRPLSDIKSDIEGDDPLTDAPAVLDSLIPREREIRTHNGVWYLARIQPYRTLDNVIDGIVLTFTDISQRIATEKAIQKAREIAEAIVNTLREPLLVLDRDLRIISASQAFYRRFKTTPDKTLHTRLYELDAHQWDIPSLRELLENILPHNQVMENYVIDQNNPVSGPSQLILNARRIEDHDGNSPALILLAMEETHSPSP